MEPALTPPGLDVLTFDARDGELRGNFAVLTCHGRTVLLHKREIARLAAAFARRGDAAPDPTARFALGVVSASSEPA